MGSTQMRMHYWIGAVMAVMLSLGVGAKAQAATQIFNFSVSDPAAGLGSGPFGQVSVTENAGALDFLVSLTSPYRFHAGNSNHNAFTFDLIGDPSITISNITSGFSRLAGASFSDPPFGSFDYALACTGCGPGYSGGKSGPLSFEVTANSGSLTLASLGFNTVNEKHIYFTSDVVNPCGCTGNVGAVLSAVPEPATWGLMIMGFMGVGIALRSKRRSLELASAA